MTRNYPFYLGEGSPHLLWCLDIEYLRSQRLEGTFQLIDEIFKRSFMAHGTKHTRTAAQGYSAVADVDDTASRQAFEGNRF